MLLFMKQSTPALKISLFYRNLTKRYNFQITNRIFCCFKSH